MLERKSGILVHPTSFPSPYGIGDLGKGATAFIDFLYKSNQKLWQILPLGPTSFGDSPYQSFSTFAGNELLISPDILIEEKYIESVQLGDFDEKKVDYGRVINYKKDILVNAFKNFTKSATKEQKKQYDKFVKDNFWLEDYCLFRALKDYFIKERDNTFMTMEYKKFRAESIDLLTSEQINDYFYGAMWITWPEDIKLRKEKAMGTWKNRLKKSIDYYKFTQYEFFRQWQAIKKYANDKDIDIIGDIPIFVSMDSSDVWARPDLFFLDKKGYPTKVAGVPPDYFAKTGQLWGNPLYNWEMHKKENYKWWVARIEKTLSTVDIVRIDHFRGFESYWEVKFGEKTAINGKWTKGPNKDLFDVIKAELGDLPIIAEDLGVITKEVRDLRDSCGLPGMKILQFAFDSSEKNDYLPHNYTDNHSVCYTGSHDNDTTVGWYSKAAEEDRDLARRYMRISGDDIAWDFIRLCFSTVSAYAIVPIQDIMSLDSFARMNTPGVASNNWQFRYTQDMLKESYMDGLKYLSSLFHRNRDDDE